jgi:hypothetical protein
MAAWLSGHDGVFGGELAHIEDGQEQFFGSDKTACALPTTRAAESLPPEW